MPILGYNGSSGWSNMQWYGYNVTNSIWLVTPLTMPSPGGFIQSISVYVAGHGGSINGILFLGYGGSVQVVSPTMTFAAGTGGLGGQAWYTYTLPSPVYLAGGTSFQVGCWVSNFVSGQAWEFSYLTTSGTQFDYATSSTEPSPGFVFPSHTIVGGSEIGAYATYVVAGTLIRRSGAWTGRTVKLFRSGAWVNATRKIFRSGAWKTI